MSDKTEGLKWLEKYLYIVIETDEENPVTIAEFTTEGVHLTDGYRVRMKPNGEPNAEN